MKNLSWAGKLGLALIGLALVVFVAAYLLGFFESNDPVPPGDAATKARAKLKLALDSWVARTEPEQFQKANPNIGFSDIVLMDKRQLRRYEIVSSKPAKEGGHHFAVNMTFLVDGKDKGIAAKYHVFQGKLGNDKEGWAIVNQTE